MLSNVLEDAEERIIISLKKLELESVGVQNERQLMRVKIKMWEEQDK